MSSIQLGKYRAWTKEESRFGPARPAVEAGAAGTFILTGLNPYGHPWGLFTTDAGFTFNTPLSGLEVECDNDSEHEWYAPKESA